MSAVDAGVGADAETGEDAALLELDACILDVGVDCDSISALDRAWEEEPIAAGSAGASGDASLILPPVESDKYDTNAGSREDDLYQRRRVNARMMRAGCEK